MDVSIFQRFLVRLAQFAFEPLQSRADQNTRKAEAGDRPSEENMKKVKRRKMVSFEFFQAGRRQTNQKIWHQVGLRCSTAAWPGIGPRAIPRLLPRGDLL